MKTRRGHPRRTFQIKKVNRLPSLTQSQCHLRSVHADRHAARPVLDLHTGKCACKPTHIVPQTVVQAHAGVRGSDWLRALHEPVETSKVGDSDSTANVRYLSHPYACAASATAFAVVDERTKFDPWKHVEKVACAVFVLGDGPATTSLHQLASWPPRPKLDCRRRRRVNVEDCRFQTVESFNNALL